MLFIFFSIGVDPNHPQVCMREPVFVRPPPDKGPPPMELARKLNSIPCSLCFKREDRISLTQLILKVSEVLIPDIIFFALKLGNLF